VNDIVISVENLGKRYSIRHQSNGGVGYQTFREMLTGYAKGLFRRNGGSDFRPAGPDLLSSRASREDFWALKNVSFEVKRGEVLGIIGRNGAGKTTVLKILSRITEPTEGRVRIKGRVATLLEVGTGFHPELTGRENIYLNGAILGMSKAEIKKKFDEIVAFAETEKFLDTPVKRYSSGMYVRLAFAVAAHLEPEILVVDEVLAVGDAEFQKKCLGKMQDVSTKEGRTVLFVSHNMATVRQLCSRAVLLETGMIKRAGNASEVINSYLEQVPTETEQNQFSLRHCTGRLNLRRVYCNKPPLRYGDPLDIITEWETGDGITAAIECVLKDGTGNPIVFYSTGITAGYEYRIPPGRHSVRIRFSALPLAEGCYSVDIIAAETNKEFLVYADSAYGFVIQESDPQKSGLRYRQGNGCVFIECEITSELSKA
jgi:lipopolysaccharide transport system ATP-binding protein